MQGKIGLPAKAHKAWARQNVADYRICLAQWDRSLETAQPETLCVARMLEFVYGALINAKDAKGLPNMAATESRARKVRRNLEAFAQHLMHVGTDDIDALRRYFAQVRPGLEL